MNNKLMTLFRIVSMFGGPIVAIYLNDLIGNKISFIIFITLISLIIVNTIYQKFRPSNSNLVKAWLYRLSVWLTGIILAQFIYFTFGGILIYILIFISFLFTYMSDNEIISFVEDFINDKKIKNLILIFSILIIGLTIYQLTNSGYDGLINYFKKINN